jgi:hypothetical protein
VSQRPPHFENFVFLGELAEPEDQLRAKILSGQIKAYIYSTLARGDFEPVPISAATFSVEEDEGWEDFSDPDPQPKPFQIMIVDRDIRRRSGTRRHIRVPHWIYVARQDLPAAPADTPSGLSLAETPAQWKNPTPEMIRAKILEVYSEEKAAGRRVPNINQTPKFVRKKLNADGYDAADNRIKTIADEPKFKALRERTGVRAT